MEQDQLEVRIQHHPARRDLLPALRKQLPKATEVIEADPRVKPDAWRDYRRCLESAHGGSHLLILQDDVLLCPHFYAAAQEAISARPDEPTCFCVCGQPREAAQQLMRAAQQGSQWAALHQLRFVPVIALAWPQWFIKPVLEWVDAQTWPKEFKADDEVVGRAFRHFGMSVNATVPSLVDHDDSIPSTIHQRQRGRSPMRRAACIIGDDCDAREIDWS